MKILWLTNIPLPEACQLMNETPSPFGGWLINASKNLSTQENIELSIAFPKVNSNVVQQLNGKKINFFTFPAVQVKDMKSIHQSNIFKSILAEVKPDIVHIFGTEFPHSLAMVNICKKQGIKTVINIQGLVSVIAKHYTVNLPIKVQKRFTLKDFLKQDNILQQQKKLERKGILEVEAIKKVDHIIGRTTWDRACTYHINPNANYYFCNETLREEFYKHQWTIEKCEKYTIFVSQAAYPIKGLHNMLEALPLILKKYPDTKLYIAGSDITASNTIKDKVKKTSYGKYITELIERYRLRNHVFFTGILNEKQMCERYINSHVFVSPSLIENSPNSLGEAMILGVPSVASDVGGVPDMLRHKEEGFVFQSDAPYMLAYYVSEIFGNKDLALQFSKNSRIRGLQTHNKEVNNNRLIEIYKRIADCKDVEVK